jgi:hypothetical protein
MLTRRQVDPVPAIRRIDPRPSLGFWDALLCAW